MERLFTAMSEHLYRPATERESQMLEKYESLVEMHGDTFRAEVAFFDWCKNNQKKMKKVLDNGYEL